MLICKGVITFIDVTFLIFWRCLLLYSLRYSIVQVFLIWYPFIPKMFPCGYMICLNFSNFYGFFIQPSGSKISTSTSIDIQSKRKRSKRWKLHGFAEVKQTVTFFCHMPLDVILLSSFFLHSYLNGKKKYGRNEVQKGYIFVYVYNFFSEREDS